MRSITRLPIQVVTTHAHFDHIGGHGYFDHIAIHRLEAPWLDGHFPLSRQMVLENNLLKQPCDFPPEFDPDQFQIYQGRPTRLLADGDWVDCGGRRLQVLHAPVIPRAISACMNRSGPPSTPARPGLSGQAGLFLSFHRPCLFCHLHPPCSPAAGQNPDPGHHQLAVSPALLQDIAQAFDSLEAAGPLVQGRGIQDFGSFSIHL